MRYPVESFTSEERALLAPHFTNLDRPVFALVNLPETVKGALFARYSRYSGTVSPPLPGGVRRRRRARWATLRRRRGRARREALRAGLPRLRRRLDRPGRRRPHRLRVGLQRPHQGPPARPPRRLPRAVDPLHPLRQAAARGRRRRLPLLPRRRARAPSSPPRWTSCSRSTRARWGGSRPGRRSAGRAATSPRGPGGARSAPRRSTCCAACCPAATLSHVGIYASGQAYEQMLLRLMASPLPEAREYGAMILRRAAAGDAELRLPGRAARPRRRVGLVPASSAARRPSAGSPGSASTAAAPRENAPSVELIHVDGTEEDLLASCLFESAAAPETEIRAPARRARPRRAGRAARRRWSESGPTAATAPAAASRRCATASRSSPTTAASATSSATGC